MEKDEIIARVNEIIREKLSLSAEDIRPDAKLKEDLGADSLDAIDITMAIEQEFSISITDFQIGQMTQSATVSDVQNMIIEALK